MRVLILTSCTGEKALQHPAQLTWDDFEQGPEHVAQREAELADVLRPARMLYTGQQHVRLLRGVDRLAAKLQVGFWVLSAGYGLVPGARQLAPYEATFAGMRKAELRRWADQLGIPAAVRELLTRPYDLGLILLGQAYLEACALDDSVVLGGPTILFGSQNAIAKLPRLASLRTVTLGSADTRRFSCGLVGLKGEVAARLLDRVAEDPQLATRLGDPTTDVLALLDTAARASAAASSKRVAPRPNPRVDRVITIPDSWWHKPHRESLRYYIPDWDDLVDPDYDFLTDTHSGGSGDWSNEVYAHQLYPEPNYDGILISKVVAEKSARKAARINTLGVHRFLRVPREFPVMGDCGAFGYIHEEQPPYRTDEILDYYTRLDFDFGVSIDHLIVTSTEAQKRERYELTIQNAEDFLREHRKLGLTWTPIGAVQGWDPKSYAQAARDYEAMGYRYIALGGLVRSTTRDILAVLAQVRDALRQQSNLHLFGISRPAAIQDFASCGVRSIDSASVLRKAWLGAKLNYLTADGWYSAIRIPQAGTSFRVRRALDNSGASLSDVQRLERECLAGIRTFAASQRDPPPDLISRLAEYDALVAGGRADRQMQIRRTLEARPWESCGCEVCRQWGVEVVIFRGNNRNRRRGFHNTAIFYRMLQEAVTNGPSAAAIRAVIEDLQTELAL